MQDNVPVTQADRDAAGRYVSNGGLCYRTACDIQLGRHDQGRLVQSFARHRLASEAEALERASALCERMQASAESLSHSAEEAEGIAGAAFNLGVAIRALKGTSHVG